MAVKPTLGDTAPALRVWKQSAPETPQPSALAGRLGTAVTALTDVAMAGVAVAVGVWWTGRGGDAAPLWIALLFIPTVLLLISLRGAYRRRLNTKFINEIGPFQATIAVAAVMWLTVMVFAGVERPGNTMARIWICAALLMPLGRLLLAVLRHRLGRDLHLMTPTLIVGNGRVAHQIIERLENSPEYGLVPIGLLDDEAPQSGDDAVPFSGVPYVGSTEDIEQAVRKTGAQSVVIAFSRSRDEMLTHVIHIAHRHGLRVWVVPRMFDVIGEKARIEHIGGLPLLALSYTNPNGWQFAVKHIFDRVAAGLGLLLISPLFLTLMLLVRVSSPGPIFFRQGRIGRDGKVFDCLKFRSMRPPRPSDADFELQLGAAPGGVEGVDRRTRIGKLMRATSMDELPQLINVIKGDMSLVGPRPERPEFVELFEMQIRRYGERHRVKAGVTGWAQVHGLRGQTSIADRAEWDNYYIENWSLALDLKILALTVAAVLRGSE